LARAWHSLPGGQAKGSGAKPVAIGQSVVEYARDRGKAGGVFCLTTFVLLFSGDTPAERGSDREGWVVGALTPEDARERVSRKSEATTGFSRGAESDEARRFQSASARARAEAS